MNLLQTIRAIEKTAALQPNVGSIVRNDAFRLNAWPAARYAAFAWLQNEHSSAAESGMITYDFTFFYIDRLTADRGNELEIQSHGIETLTNILDALPDLGLYPSEYTFRTFNQRFSDECAGVFCNVSLEARKDGLCAEAYDFVEGAGSFDMSFDESFDCWRWVIDGKKTIYIH